jgi:methylmalonyl-CoA mutase
MIGFTSHSQRYAGMQGIYGPGSNVVECAANVLRLLGHNMPSADEDLDEATE